MLRLRKSVNVSFDSEMVKFTNSTYNLELPSVWVEENPIIKELLKSGISSTDDRIKQGELAGVFEFFKRSGYFAFEEKDRYSLRECRTIYGNLVSEWYSEYYKHPLWEKARNGNLTRNGLLAWLIHNYHTSKAAGMTDARAAVGMPTLALRQFFKKNCLEEYWHCEAFYFVRHQNLSIDDNDVKTYIPLPSSTAFEQHATGTVENDWMANVLISYFQESSIKFYDDAVNFYKQVEEKYHIEGLFDSWIQHMSLDLDHDHANELGELLETESFIAKDQLVKSIKSANRAFRFLVCSLNEVLLEDIETSAPQLRKPVVSGEFRPESNSLLSRYNLISMVSVYNENPLLLYRNLIELGLNKTEANFNSCGEADSSFFNNSFVTSFYRALSFAETHEQVILFGKLAETYLANSDEFDKETNDDYSLWALALSNFINSVSYKPRLFAFLLLHLLNIKLQLLDDKVSENSCEWLPIEEKGRIRIENYLEMLSFTSAEIDSACNLILQCNEFINLKSNYSEQDKPIFVLG